MKNNGLSIVMFVLAACAFCAGTYGAVSIFLFWRPQTHFALLSLGFMFSTAGAFILAGRRLSENDTSALAIILMVVGLGTVVTRPHSNDPVLDRLSGRAFQIAGALVAGVGCVTYLRVRRRVNN